MTGARVSAAGAALRAFGALMLAALLVFLVPLALIRFVGWPFPTVVPSLDEISFALRTGSIDPQTWIKGLALVAWFAWAQIALAFVVEVIALVRGRTATAMWGFGGAQWIAARTIAQVALAAAVLVKTSTAVAAPLPAFPIPAPTIAQEMADETVAEVVKQRVEDERLSTTVSRRDTLMSLAAQHLGSADRWTELREANVGRIMPDGTELTSSFTRIKPGWTLVLPPDATTHHVVDGDNLWELSETQLEADLGREATDAEITPYWAEVVDENRADLLPPGDPDLIYPGQSVVLPPTGEAPERFIVVGGPDSAVGEDSTSSGDGAGDVGEGRGAVGETVVDAALIGSAGGGVDVDQHSATSPDGRTLMAFAGGGLLAAGMLGLLGRERTRRLAARRRGDGVPSGDVELEQSLVEAAESEAALALFAAIDSLADRSVQSGEPVAQADVVMATPAGLDVVMSSPVDDLPEPWRSQGDAQLFPVEELDAVLSAAGPAAVQARHWASPTLVTVADSIVVNLESIGVLSIDGPPDPAAALVRSMVHELATGPGRRQLDIRCSMDVAGAALHDCVRHEPVEALANEIQRWLDRLDLTLGAAGAASGYALRISGGDAEPITPLVLFVSAAELEQIEPVLHRARTRRYPLAVVVVGRCPAVATASIHADGMLHLAPYGHEAPAQQLAVEVVERVMTAVNQVAAAPLRSVISLDPNVAARWAADEAAQTTTDRSDVEATDSGGLGAAPGQVELVIRLLGPVSVDGAKGDLSDIHLSLLAYLSVVGDATPSQVQQALWPHKEPSESRLAALLSETRRAVGRAVLPERNDGRLALEGVSVDIDRARVALRQARDLEGDERIRRLEDALNEITGPPFEGAEGRAWRWITDQYSGIATQAAVLLSDAAVEAARAARADGDDDRFARSVAKGRLVAPLNQELMELELTAAEGVDATDRVRSAWEDAYHAAVETFAPEAGLATNGGPELIGSADIVGTESVPGDTIDRSGEVVHRG